MPSFEQLDEKELAKISSLGGKAKAEKDKSQDKSFEDVVKEETTYRDLKELYDGLLKSGKKGNVKATETLLRYLEKGKEEKPTTLDEFVDNADY